MGASIIWLNKVFDAKKGIWEYRVIIAMDGEYYIALIEKRHDDDTPMEYYYRAKILYPFRKRMVSGWEKSVKRAVAWFHGKPMV